MLNLASKQGRRYGRTWRGIAPPQLGLVAPQIYGGNMQARRQKEIPGGAFVFTGGQQFFYPIYNSTKDLTNYLTN